MTRYYLVLALGVVSVSFAAISSVSLRLRLWSSLSIACASPLWLSPRWLGYVLGKNCAVWLDAISFWQCCQEPSWHSTLKEKTLPLSFSPNCLLALRLAQPGDRRNRVIRSRMAANRSPGTATSANWKIICRAWRTIRPPILISFT